MAYTDIITDGTDTVNLGSIAAETFSDRLSYVQQIPEKNAMGEYPLVTEQWVLNWNDTSDDTRGSTHAKLLRLKRKAQKWANKDYREGAVWRELRSSTENASKYAVVHNVHIPELDPNTYGPQTGFRITPITVTREGAWRTFPPGQSGPLLYGRSLVSSTSVYNFNYNSATDYVSWVTITPGEGTNELPGDADALIRFTVFTGTRGSYNRFTIAKRTADTLAELNGFKPYFNPADIAYSSPAATLTPAATVAGGQRLDTNNASGSEQTYYYSWAYDPEYYQGEFLMVIPIKMGSTSDYAWLAPMHNDASSGAGNRELGDEVYVSPWSDASFYRTITLGPISLPVTGHLPAYESSSYPSSYRLGFSLRLPNGMSCQIKHWWLVPIDEGVQEIRNIINIGSSIEDMSVIVDGYHRVVYNIQYPEDPDPEYILPKALQPSGRFLTAAHQKYTRFYFYEGYTSAYSATYQGSTDGVVDVLRSMSVSVQGVPRYRAFYSDDIY